MTHRETSSDTARLISHLRFRHLRLLVEIGRGGSLRSVASLLNATQPALSRSLAEIEKAFGLILFTRTPNGLKATKQGQVAIRGATVLLEELDHVRTEAAHVDGIQTLIKIGAPPFIAEAYLPAVFARLVEQMPFVRLELHEAGAPALLDTLAQGQVDAIVSAYPDQTHESLSRFRYESLFNAEFVVVARGGHALANKRLVSWKEISGERWILPPKGSMLRRMVDDWFMRAGSAAPVPLAESATPVVNLRMAAAGVGFAIVPTAAFHFARDVAEVTAIKVYPPMPGIDIALISRQGSNPRVAALRRAILVRS